MADDDSPVIQRLIHENQESLISQLLPTCREWVKNRQWRGNTQNNPDYYPTLKETAEYLGVSDRSLRNSASTGEIIGVAADKSVGGWVFSQDEVARFEAIFQLVKQGKITTIPTRSFSDKTLAERNERDTLGPCF